MWDLLVIGGGSGGLGASRARVAAAARPIRQRLRLMSHGGITLAICTQCLCDRVILPMISHAFLISSPPPTSTRAHSPPSHRLCAPCRCTWCACCTCRARCPWRHLCERWLCAEEGHVDRRHACGATCHVSRHGLYGGAGVGGAVAELAADEGASRRVRAAPQWDLLGKLGEG